MTGPTTPRQVVWITDSTPLISLAKVGLLHLVTTLAGKVLVPQTVVDEVMAGRQDDPARQALVSGWGGRVPSPAIPPPLAAMALDAGEESVLAAALALPGSAAVLDDGKARNAARALGVPVIGSLGIVARAKA